MQSSEVANQAPQACRACKAKKKKCDKGLPKCSSCSKKGLTCDYSYSKLESNGRTMSSPWQYLTPNEDSREEVQHLDFPTLLFLDPEILQHGQVEIPRATILVPAHILQLVGDIADFRVVASHFFETIHTWIPFISIKRFYDHHLQPSFHSRADLVLLFLCMKLITEMPPDPPRSPKTPAYYAAKHFYLEVETSGLFSIQVLQAGILLALYELGHAIYPAAFSSVGACARFAYALGINCNTLQASKVLTLIEREERRRVWWAIVVLDRFVSIGCPGRPFVTEDPGLDELLPADDSAWDQGTIIPNTAFTLRSPTNSHMSKFALVCQAARLLGQVLRHVSAEVVDQTAYDEEAVQLHRTLEAMINASEDRQSPDYDQLSFAYSAIITLHGPSNNKRAIGKDYWQVSRSVLQMISATTVDCLPDKITYLIRNIQRIPPWGLYLAYRAAVTYLRLEHEPGSPGSIKELQNLRQTFRTMDVRWRVAGTYLQMLEAREVMGVI